MVDDRDPERFAVRDETFRFADRETVDDRFPLDANEHAAAVASVRALHEKLQAESRRAVLVVLMAVDTGGKDPTVDDVFGRVSLSGVRVAHFASPTDEEDEHDFLWRVHEKVPRHGEIAVFNRSQYDAIVEPRLDGTIDEDEVGRRIGHVRAFEELLADSGTVVRKFFLYISRSEQARRIEERLDDPSKRWEFDPHDVDVHQRWDEYHAVYERLIATTSTPRSPWYVIPADDPDVRNMIVAQVMRATLEAMDPRFPEVDEDLDRYRAVLVSTTDAPDA